MAVDFGDARTGVAVSDEGELLVGQTAVVHARKPEKAAEEVAALALRLGAEELVVGLPKNMDGSEGPRAALCREFAALLEKLSGKPVRLWDERRTTVDAHRILSDNHVFGKKRKNVVDAVAASLILEGYLAYRKNQF
jgi:putative Holliday junction resolvase